MMSLDEMKAELEDRNLVAVAAKTGISYGTLLAIRAGTANPTERTLSALDAYLRAVCRR
jgi:hypothetical protein